MSPDEPANAGSAPGERDARHLKVTGRVQGVGFRPFVYRLATRLQLAGWVRNRNGEVEIALWGSARDLDAFERRLIDDAPPLARPELVASRPVEPPEPPPPEFTIRPSDAASGAEVHVPPDQFTCDDCLAELREPTERRYRYPFINCTQCGPRYTLIEALPYDRARTSLRDFPLCPDCGQEYADPLDRRFHAEPLACPRCGPSLSFWSADEQVQGNEAALNRTLDALRAGRIVAVKGVGGYHLVCDAGNEVAIRRLRQRKHRPHKPLALLFPWRGKDGLDAVRAQLAPAAEHAAALIDPSRPVVLVPRRDGSELPADLAPGLAEIGVMLPYSPLHHLLADGFGGALVATSANLSGEPVLTDNAEAASRLSGLCDAFLHHDRPILRPADDSVLRVIAQRPRRLRLGRGLAPLELVLPRPVERPTLAVGGHMKNTVALAWGRRVVVSPHVGELDSPRSVEVFENTISMLCDLYQVEYELIAHDLHPGYRSTRWALAQADARGIATRSVLHHAAHAAMLAGAYPDEARWLVFTWDGTGLGADRSIWGGEALLGRPGDWRRVASLRPFRLPGGDRAGREPWRSAAALNWELGYPWRPSSVDAELARVAWQRGMNVPVSSAAGRLFDAAAAMLGLIERGSFEGQAPMLLEAAAGDLQAEPLALPLTESEEGLLRTDWAPLIDYLRGARDPAVGAAVTHASLAASLCAQALALRERHGDFAVGLSGGVFQNRRLAETALTALAQAGLRAYLPVDIPYNDAGLSYGQIIDTLPHTETVSTA